MQRGGAVLILLALAGAGWYGLRSQQPPGAAVREPVTLLVTMGLKARQPERWDGSVELINAKLAAIEGRHFSEGDSTSADGTWICTTRRDAVAPYADIHYTEMRPGEVPPVLHKPVGVVLMLDAQAGARAAIVNARGRFDFAVDEIGPEPRAFADGAFTVQRVPSAEKLSTDQYEDDEPSVAVLPNGDVAVAWVAYREQADRVLFRVRHNGVWSETEEVSPPGDVFRTSIAATQDGAVWVFWSRRDGQKWTLWGRQRSGRAWGDPVAVSGAESATFHRAAAGGNTIWAVWQGIADGQSDIFARAVSGGPWGAAVKVSTSRANDWEPAVAVSADGTAHVVWDSYDKGNYDVMYRSVAGGSAGALRAVTTSPRFQAHASVAVDAQGRPWIGWDESGVNWGKDQGFLIPTPLATPLHQQRWLRIAMWDGGKWSTPAVEPPHTDFNAEHPQLAFSPTGTLVVAFRHWTRRVSRTIGSAITWQNYVTAFDGARWSSVQPLPDAGSWIEKPPALATGAGSVWIAWMSDNRAFVDCVPKNADVYAARVPGIPAGRFTGASVAAFVEKAEEAIPVHNNESTDVAAIRSQIIAAGGKRYRIFRGDMHRHTDLSQDFKYDGSLFEVYRYAMDAAGFDYVAATDHQTGYDQEFAWWQHEKYVDLFLAANRFVPMFGYERSLRYPNGHRNIIRAQRGYRTLPIPVEEASGREGAKKLFEHLRATNGISMPHSSATDQGTDWRDNDPKVEPLVEIYQGYRNSYEYEGAPRAATTLNQHAQKSGWQPMGFYWNALDKGYKLGVQASSDHWSTHISYACLLTESPTREGLLDAIRKRHAYAATDNIILDFRARVGSTEYIQGDEVKGGGAARLVVRTVGTGAIKQIDLIGNKRFLYTTRPGTKTATFEFTDQNPPEGESWYYVRVLQEDGQLAWSSPIWIQRR